MEKTKVKIAVIRKPSREECNNCYSYIEVEEGIYGDVITFIYKGKKYQSRAVSGSRPG